MIVVLLGPPGVGKGTQGELMARRFGIPRIVTGDMLREEVRESTSLGREASSYMSRGELVPDSLIIGMIEKRIVGDGVRKGFILDGFPRTVVQAEAFDRMLDKYGLVLSRVIFINVPDDDVIRRLSGRRICEKCGAVYHVVFDPPSVQGVCDKCGGNLLQRKDDREETILKRLKVYNEITAPLVAYYRDRNLLLEIDGSGSIEEVFNRIVKEIK